jgi:hypothetical protein
MKREPVETVEAENKVSEAPIISVLFSNLPLPSTGQLDSSTFDRRRSRSCSNVFGLGHGPRCAFCSFSCAFMSSHLSTSRPTTTTKTPSLPLTLPSPTPSTSHLNPQYLTSAVSLFLHIPPDRPLPLPRNLPSRILLPLRLPRTPLPPLRRHLSGIP